MKNNPECNVFKNSHAVCNKRIELIENQINFLQEECNSETKMINCLLENLFNYRSHQTDLHHDGKIVLTPNEAEYHYQNKLKMKQF